MEIAVTVIGRDRTGIIADVAGALAALGANLTDSTMTRLRGNFAMTLICTVEATVAAVELAMRPLAAEFLLGVREISPDEPAAPAGSPFVLSVHGADRLGIVSALTRVIAQAGGNITDLSTRLSGQLYLIIAEVDVPPGQEEALHAALDQTAADLGVEARLRPAESEVL
jgi:glycine cleavage system transcriptional repressor